MFFKSNDYLEINKILKLDKPLIVFNVKTTGIQISADKIINISYIKQWSDGHRKKAEIHLNPEIEISSEAEQIHRISNDDVKDKPTFRDKSQEIWDLFNDCFYGGYNIMNFDLPVLRREFVRIGMNFEYDIDHIIDSKKIYRYMVPRTFSAVYEYYTGKKIPKEKSSMFEAEASAKVLEKQIKDYKTIGSLELIGKINRMDESLYNDNTIKFYWQNGEAFFAFSKYQDKSLFAVIEEDPGFIQWILSADFSEETKNIVRAALKKYGNRRLKEESKNKEINDLI